MALIWYCRLFNRKCSIFMFLLIPVFQTLSFWLADDDFSLRWVLFWATNLLQILHRNKDCSEFPCWSLLFSWDGFSVPAWRYCLGVLWKSHSCCWLLYFIAESMWPNLPLEDLWIIFWDVELHSPLDLVQGKIFFGNEILIWCFDLVQEACFTVLLEVGQYYISRTLTHLKIISSHITGTSSWEAASKTQPCFCLDEVKPEHFNSNEVYAYSRNGMLIEFGTLDIPSNLIFCLWSLSHTYSPWLI